MSSELETAENSLYSEYSKKNANYVMEITTPSGKRNREIQNIRYLDVNKNPVFKLENSYKESKTFYSCDIKGTSLKPIAYTHRYIVYTYKDKMLKDTPKQETSSFFQKGDCMKFVEERMRAINATNTSYCRIKVFDYSKNPSGDLVDTFHSKNVDDKLKGHQNANSDTKQEQVSQTLDEQEADEQKSDKQGLDMSKLEKYNDSINEIRIRAYNEIFDYINFDTIKTISQKNKKKVEEYLIFLDYAFTNNFIDSETDLVDLYSKKIIKITAYFGKEKEFERRYFQNLKLDEFKQGIKELLKLIN